MYPVPRLFWQLFLHRNDPPMGLHDEHVSKHLCLPWDLDIWWELNNGRTLTFYDLGRVPMGEKTGLHKALKRRKWGLTVAGSSVRYRKRIVAFELITIRSRIAGWDGKFFYTEQSMWKKNGDCAGHVLIRSAVTSAKGIVSPTELLAEMGHDEASPKLADWVTAWIDADAQRPWPPMSD